MKFHEIPQKVQNLSPGGPGAPIHDEGGGQKCGNTLKSPKWRNFMKMMKFHEISWKFRIFMIFMKFNENGPFSWNFMKFRKKCKTSPRGAPGRGRLGPRFIYRCYVRLPRVLKIRQQICVFGWFSRFPRVPEMPYFGVHFGPPRDPPWRAKSEEITKFAKFH